MLTTSPSSPGIHIPPPFSIPNTRSGCSLPRELSIIFEWNSAPKTACFGIGPYHGGARDAPNRSQLTSSDAGSLPCLT
jgi:hypothetical protein